MLKFLKKFLLQCVGSMKYAQSQSHGPNLRTEPEGKKGKHKNSEIPTVKVSSRSSEMEPVIESDSGIDVQAKTAALWQKYGCQRSTDNEYRVLKFLGEGSFGKVTKCLKKETGEVVAVKISKFADFRLFSNECSILNKVNFDDPDKFCFVRNLENFMYMDRYFMVFEMLEKNLCEHITENGNRPLPMEAIRYITQQLLIAQNKLRDLHIIHGDLKPENIMLVNHQQEPYRIKIIDFGMSIQLPSRFYSPYLGTLTYRAPEVILGMRYSEAIDTWSIGCIMAEMLIGHILYPGNTPYDQLRFIDEMQGPFPDYMLYSSKLAEEYFCLVRNIRSVEFKWRVKTPTEYHRDTGILSSFRSYRLENLDALLRTPTEYHRDTGILSSFRSYRLENLDALLRVCSRVRKDYDEVDRDRKYCVDLIKEMLQISVPERILPDDALECNFFNNGTPSNNEIYHDTGSSFP